MKSAGAGREWVRIPVVLALCAAFVYGLAGAGRDFWAPDEPDFAEAVREMGERGSYLLPYQNGVPYSEKPPLFYWAVAATTVLSGGDVHPAATRIPSVLAGAFLVFAAAALAGWRGGDLEAGLAGSLTAVAPLVFWQGQFLQVDALFSALLLLVFLAQMLVELDAERASRWVFVFHVGLAASVLTKGPLAIVLAGLVALVSCARERSWSPILRLRPFRGALVVALLVVPWYVLAARAGGPEYTYDLIVNQNWNRFFRAFDHIRPWHFYLGKIWGDFAPWTLLAVLAPIPLRRWGLFRSRPELLHAAVVCGTALVFLSASESKQGKYLLVAYPLASVLVAALVGEAERRRGGWLRGLRAYAALVAGLLLAGAIALGPAARSRAPELAWLVPWLAVPLGAGAVVAVLLLVVRRRRLAPALLALAGTLAVAEVVAGTVVFPAIDLLKTGRPFYDRIRPIVGGKEPLAYFGLPYRSYPILQLRRRTAHTVTEGDLAGWLGTVPGPAYVLVDASAWRGWKSPALRGLAVVDRQQTGQDEILLLRRP